MKWNARTINISSETPLAFCFARIRDLHEPWPIIHPFIIITVRCAFATFRRLVSQLCKTALLQTVSNASGARIAKSRSCCRLTEPDEPDPRCDFEQRDHCWLMCKFQHLSKQLSSWKAPDSGSRFNRERMLQYTKHSCRPSTTAPQRQKCEENSEVTRD